MVTNGLRTAELLADCATVVMTGGTLRSSSWSLTGDHADVPVRGGQLAYGFFGVRSLSVAHGLLELSSEEAAAKTQLAAACQRVYALFDSSKSTRFALHPFVPADRVTGLFTDAGFPDEAADEWSRAGAAVHRVC